MEEELLKRNTDCVYFLASPLTCKNGVDCEYRHSDIARLNPRDCWYWLSGNCLNQTCAFRHPPLDGHVGPPSDTASHSMPVVKTKAPCYFYFNGFCNRGDKCFFLHNIEDSVSTGKSSKTTSVIADSISSENKTSIGKDSIPPPTYVDINPSGIVINTGYDSRVNLKDDFQRPVFNDVPQQRSSCRLSDFEFEEIATTGSGSLLPAEGFVQTIFHESADLVSEEHVDGHTDMEGRWKSSQGFDVLVDGKSEHLNLEDDQENFLELGMKQKNLSSQFFGYEFENQAVYDPTFPEAERLECLYDNEICGAYDPRDDDHSFSNIRRLSINPKEKLVHSILPCKRKLMPIDPALEDQDNINLRDHLRRRRITESHSFTVLLGMHESSQLIGRSRERSRQHGTRRLHRRFASQVRNITVESLPKHGTLSNGRHQRSSLGHLQQNGSAKLYKEKRHVKRQYASSEVSKKQRPKDCRIVQHSTIFTGPKTLAQIKQEKRNTEEKGNVINMMGHSGRTTSENFQGPKPLSEILKEKNKAEQLKKIVTED